VERRAAPTLSLGRGPRPEKCRPLGGQNCQLTANLRSMMMRTLHTYMLKKNNHFSVGDCVAQYEANQR
jgi:hypothetical protein